MMKAVVAALGLSVASLLPGVALAQDKTESGTAGVIDVGSGASIVPPAGWATTRAGPAVRFAPPEKNVTVAIIPVAAAKDGQDAAVQAWRQTRADFSRPVRIGQKLPARDGWDEIFVVYYDVPPAEQVAAQAIAMRKGAAWTVVTVEGAIATIAKRGAQLNAASQTLRPKGYAKESFAGKKAHPLDAARIEALKDFVRTSMAALKVPGVGLALIDDGKIVYEGGLGVTEVGGGEPVNENTLFMIASNTKGMATLLLADLVDEGRLDWEKPVTHYLPSFRLGSEETTKKVLVKHLVCACTGLPRKDMQWLFNTRADTAADDTFRQLAATEPTSGFGEVFQYNNLMASAAGYLGAHILYPGTELGAGFDRAMKERIFDPLGMRRTTFRTSQATAGNWARPHDVALSGELVPVDLKLNDTVMPYRPAGGAWSSAHDMALYVKNELDEGRLASGKQLLSKEHLLARRVRYVPTGENRWYGMGLEEDAKSGVSVIQHDGSMFGYKSNWFAVPEAGAGVVVLTNSDSGYALTNAVKRRLLELLYDGKPEAAADVASIAERSGASLAKLRSEITLPVQPEVASKLVGAYRNADLGPLTISREGDKLMMRATSVWSEVGTMSNKDGTISVVSVSPGFKGQDLLVATRDGKRALVLNDSQHEYVFVDAAR